MSKEQHAKELIERFEKTITEGLVFTDDINPKRDKFYNDKAKACASILCSEMIKEFEAISFGHDIEINDEIKYWQDIKNIINHEQTNTNYRGE